MKRNNIIKCFLAGLVGYVVITTMSSCRFVEDDYFDESASLRVERTNKELQDILVTPENGWIMQYFCGVGVAHFEGFNLFAHFDTSGKVTLASNHRMLRNGNAGQYKESTSLYSLLLEDGPVLAFNTWNDVLSPFVDPVSPYSAPAALYKDGAGMQGDNNFSIISYNDDEIIMHGERYKGQVRLIKCEQPWQDYIADTEAMKAKISSTSIPNYYVISDEETKYFLTEGNTSKMIDRGLVSGRVQFSEDLTNPVHLDSLACVFTPTGIRFEKKDSVGLHPFQEFTLNEDETALVNEDGTIRVFATWDHFLANSTEIMWMEPESLSDDLKALSNEIDAALTSANKNHSLARIGIGRTTNANNVTGLVVQWYTNTRKTSRNMGGLELERSVPGPAQIAIVCEPDAIVDNNMKARHENVISAVRAFGAALAGTYDVTPESYFVPSSATYTSADGSKHFTVAP